MEVFEVSRNHGEINQEPSVNEQLGGSGGTKSPRRPEALARGVRGAGRPPGKKNQEDISDCRAFFSEHFRRLTTSETCKLEGITVNRPPPLPWLFPYYDGYIYIYINIYIFPF